MDSNAAFGDRQRPVKQSQTARVGSNAPARGWPVVADIDTDVAPAVSSIDMPRADTELTNLLAGDDTLFVRRKLSQSLPAKPALDRESTHRIYSDAEAETLNARRHPYGELGIETFSDAASDYEMPGNRDANDAGFGSGALVNEHRETELGGINQNGIDQSLIDPSGDTEGGSDLDFARIQAAWPHLTRAAKATVLALMDAALE